MSLLENPMQSPKRGDRMAGQELGKSPLKLHRTPVADLSDQVAATPGILHLQADAGPAHAGNPSVYRHPYAPPPRPPSIPPTNQNGRHGELRHKGATADGLQQPQSAHQAFGQVRVRGANRIDPRRVQGANL